MIEVDARGLSCPEPVMMTNDALKNNSEVKVLVDEAYQKTNVEKLVREKGYKSVSTDKDDYYEVVITK